MGSDSRIFTKARQTGLEVIYFEISNLLKKNINDLHPPMGNVHSNENRRILGRQKPNNYDRMWGLLVIIINLPTIIVFFAKNPPKY